MTNTIALLLGNEGSLSETAIQSLAAIPDCRCERAATSEIALSRLDQGAVAVVLIALEGRTIEEIAVGVLNACRGRTIPAIVLMDAPDPERRLRLLGRGAIDCLSSPIDTGRLAFLVDFLTLRSRGGRQESAEKLQADPENPRSFGDFLVAGPAMRRLVERFHRVAPMDTTILLTGETGCGKTHAAQLIHDLSPRRGKPLMVVLCGALSPTLIESELFGHVRGAFTGADRDYAGKFAGAQDGTLLLDEIDSVPLECQAKLLRAVDNRIYESVGSIRPQPLRARLIVATNRSLEDEMAQGRFRSDLYYRLNVVTFRIPPLRERREEIGPLATKFLAGLLDAGEPRIQGFTTAALRAMQTYSWPGNLRELHNAVEQAVALCEGRLIDVSDLPEAVERSWRVGRPVSNPPPSSAANGLMAARRDGEMKRLLEALQRHRQNRTSAAAELGISRATLYRKLHQYGLE